MRSENFIKLCGTMFEIIFHGTLTYFEEEC